jgi:hypothetical protein
MPIAHALAARWFLVAGLCVAGCAGLGTPGAASVSSADPPVALELSLSVGGNRWCPSSWPPTQLRATVRTASGRLINTPSAFDARGPSFAPGELSPRQLAFEVVGAALTPELLLLAPPQPLDLMTRVVSIQGKLVAFPAVQAAFVPRVFFDCDQMVWWSGRAGRAGVNGGHGEVGEQGPDVDVAVGLANDPAGQRLVFVRATPASGLPSYFVLAPGRRLFLSLPGGEGGRGGDAPFADGPALNAGSGGNGGDGGRAVIRFDRRHPVLRGAIVVNNPGGAGGGAGAARSGVGFARGQPGAFGDPGRPGPIPRYRPEDASALFADEIQRGLPIVRGADKRSAAAPGLL